MEYLQFHGKQGNSYGKKEEQRMTHIEEAARVVVVISDSWCGDNVPSVASVPELEAMEKQL